MVRGMRSQSRELKQYVTEEFNPENNKGVQGRRGVCSQPAAFFGYVHRGHARPRGRFSPEIAPQPKPSSLTSMQHWLLWAPTLPWREKSSPWWKRSANRYTDLILVLNKADRTTDAERAAATVFTRQLLQKRLQREIGPMFEISAQERADNRGPERDWNKLVATLQRLVDRSGHQLVRAACDPRIAASQ